MYIFKPRNNENYLKGLLNKIGGTLTARIKSRNSPKNPDKWNIDENFPTFQTLLTNWLKREFKIYTIFTLSETNGKALDSVR